MPIPKNNPFQMKTSDTISEILLYNDIGMWGITAENFYRSVESMGSGKKKLRVNSYGGEVFDGNAMHNKVKGDAENWEAEIDGVAASISSLIPLAAKTVKMHANAMIMIHNPAVGVIGDANKLRQQADVLDDIKNNAIDTYHKRMKNTPREELVELMNKGTWYTAKRALDAGLIDEIIDPIEVEEPATNRETRVPTNMGKSVFVNYKSEIGQVPVNKKENFMKCPKCGKEHAEGAVYCSACASPMDATLAMKAAHDQEVKEAVMAATNRITNIIAACKKHNIDETFTQELLKGNDTYEQCALKILDKVSVLPPVPPQTSPAVALSADERDKFVAHATNCLMVASGIERDPKKVEDSKKDEFVNSVQTLMRLSLEKKGIRHTSMSAVQLADKMFSMIGSGSSDLPAALENIANKSLQKGYDESPTTYQLWAGRREVDDFKTNTIVDVSNFGDLKDLPEGAPFEDSKISDKKETFNISTKGRKFTYSRQMAINDDLGVLTNMQYKIGQAAARAVNRGFYDKLTVAGASILGPALSDTVALFNEASHHNLVSDSGLVSVTSLSEARRKLREMPLMEPEPGAGLQYANLTAKYLVTGTANEQAIEQVIGSGMDISKSIVGVYNPFTRQNTMLIVDPYLQSLLTAAGYANAWYSVADQNASETMGVAYLRGNTSPTMRYEASTAGNPLGFIYDIYFDWGYYLAGHRGIILNDGVTAT